MFFIYCSKLSLGILKKRYLALVGQESLNSEIKTYMKQVVEEELMKMQVFHHHGLLKILRF